MNRIKIRIGNEGFYLVGFQLYPFLCPITSKKRGNAMTFNFKSMDFINKVRSDLIHYYKSNGVNASLIVF